MPSGRISIHGYAETVDAVCDALGVERVAVVGNSMGGFIGAELALSFDTRVDRLVLVSAAGLSTEHLRAPRGVGARRRRAAPVRRLRVRRRAPPAAAARGDAVGVRYPEKLSVPLAQELVLSSASPASCRRSRRSWTTPTASGCPQIEIPVLIVWGRNDMLVPVDDATPTPSLIGDNARVEVFEDTGHAPMLERPTRFNESLRGFLGRGGAEAGVAGRASSDAHEGRRDGSATGVAASAAPRRRRRLLAASDRRPRHDNDAPTGA